MRDAKAFLQTCDEFLPDAVVNFAEFFAKGKDGFSPCSGCAIRPRQMARTVASDWDPARECLSADSAARNY